MEIAGYAASVLIGLSLGLIGGGGSILTVPVMVYLFSVDAVLATTYSLFVVGATSLVGSISYFKKNLAEPSNGRYIRHTFCYCRVCYKNLPGSFNTIGAAA